ncbi:expressed unknown protein [Seminavis robusta]|uniref:Uncharacterized protein n=1 Tax=Seminavis robusta TaxID=568900 RepID=A0A9N8DW18_9STRA|nr:expressed unknown protein [Seminavis robusta]|eukprot:Sro405_g136250.1 n/a (113) ;mRNA; f:57982-58320
MALAGEQRFAVAGIWLAYLGWAPFDAFVPKNMGESNQVVYVAILMAASVWFSFWSVVIMNGIGLAAVMEATASQLSFQGHLYVTLPIMGLIAFNLWTLVKVSKKVAKALWSL